MILGPVDIRDLYDWIVLIPFEDWPQQHKIDEQLRPAMVTDLAWHGFGEVSQPLVEHVMGTYFHGLQSWQRMLSVVMPGHSIPPHIDEQDKNWKTRVHIPLTNNSQSFFLIEGLPHRFDPGYAFTVDTTKQHSVSNLGETPRIHFMFDVGKR